MNYPLRVTLFIRRIYDKIYLIQPVPVIVILKNFYIRPGADGILKNNKEFFMKKPFFLAFLLFISIIFVIRCHPSGQNSPEPEPSANKGRESAILVKQVSSIFGVIPEQMAGTDEDTEELVRLGEKLYFEKKLSDNGKESCNSCHTVDNKKGGVDNLSVSEGKACKRSKRNTPTVLNAGYQFAQFWDGRAVTLEEQLKGHMAYPSKKLKEKLSKEYKDLFKKAFPKDDKPFTVANVNRAIASYERTLKTSDRFDEFIKGNHNALTDEQQKGLELFISSGCITCHAGPLLGGNMYQKIGIKKPYENTADSGRYEITKDKADKFIFKVPMLRNIAITAPYYHDGKIKTIEDAVKKMGTLQLGKDFSDSETGFIVSFFKSLTDTKRM